MNDLLVVNAGEGVPVDGVLVFGRGSCNESMLTGEAKPVSKDIGSPLYGGSILQQG